MDVYNLVSFTGIFVLIGFAWLLSADRKNMNWRVIGWGIFLQMLIGLFVFGRLVLAPGQVSEKRMSRYLAPDLLWLVVCGS